MKRDPIFDYMKGLGIIAVVLGHYYPGTIVSHIIYSFHMPLFFIVSGYFLNIDKPIVSSVIHDMKRLLLPIAITISTIVIYKLIMKENLTGSNRFGAFSVRELWFLLALFWSRLILRLTAYIWHHITTIINSRVLLTGSIVVSALVYYFHSLLPYWHIYLIHGLAAIQFVTLGWFLRRERHICFPIWLQLCFVAFWVAALMFGGLNMNGFEYKFYPLDILGSIGGTMIVYYVCKGMDYMNSHNSKPFRWICAILGWCGVHSLLILCLHTFDSRALHLGKRFLFIK